MELIPMTDFVLERETEWRPVVGFESYYEVSNIGRCRSLARDIIYNNDIKSRKGTWKGKILKPTIKPDGYVRYNLSIGGKTYRVSAHRMVAKAFIPNPENKRVVNHKDSIRNNNIIENLEWATDSENQKHSYEFGNRKAKFYGYCCVKKDIQLTKLVSLKDFVLDFEPTREQITNYANFLNKTLKLGYFIPTDKDGNVLEFEVFQGYVILGDNKESKKNKISKGDTLGFIIYEGSKYQAAKERILFEGFEVEKFGKSGEVWKLEGDKIKINIFKFPNGNYEFYVEDWSNAAITSQEVTTIEDLTSYGLKLTQTAIKQINE